MMRYALSISPRIWRHKKYVMYCFYAVFVSAGRLPEKRLRRDDIYDYGGSCHCPASCVDSLGCSMDAGDDVDSSGYNLKHRVRVCFQQFMIEQHQNSVFSRAADVTNLKRIAFV